MEEDENDDDGGGGGAAGAGAFGDGPDASEAVVFDEEEEEVRHREAMRGRAFSLKRLIKVLHISEPVYHVLCLLGKKYADIFSLNFI